MKTIPGPTILAITCTGPQSLSHKQVVSQVRTMAHRSRAADSPVPVRVCGTVTGVSQDLLLFHYCSCLNNKQFFCKCFIPFSSWVLWTVGMLCLVLQLSSSSCPLLKSIWGLFLKTISVLTASCSFQPRLVTSEMSFMLTWGFWQKSDSLIACCSKIWL